MTDLLRSEYINGLPQPLIAHIFGDRGQCPWPVYDIEVQCAILRIDVVGKLQVVSMGEVEKFVDASGIEHDPDTFWLEYLEVPNDT